MFHNAVGESRDELISWHTAIDVLGYGYEVVVSCYLFCKDKHLSAIVSGHDRIDMLLARMFAFEDLANHVRDRAV